MTSCYTRAFLSCRSGGFSVQGGEVKTRISKMHSWREESKEIFYKNKKIRKETQQKRDGGKKTRMFALGEEVKINNWNGGLSFWRTIICFKETVQRTEGYTGEKKDLPNHSEEECRQRKGRQTKWKWEDDAREGRTRREQVNIQVGQNQKEEGVTGVKQTNKKAGWSGTPAASTQGRQQAREAEKRGREEDGEEVIGEKRRIIKRK